MARKKTAGETGLNAIKMAWNRHAMARSESSKSKTPARNRGASGSTMGGAGNAKRPPKKDKS